MHRLILIIVLLLGGCVSYTYDISDRPPYSEVGVGPARTTNSLNLYRVSGSGGSSFRPYVLSSDIIRNSENPLALVRTFPAGSEVRIQKIFRESAPDGYLWDFVFGTILVDGAEFEFETNLGLSDAPRPMPFQK